MPDDLHEALAWWALNEDFNPNDHMMDLKGKDDLQVAWRLYWFIKDQRRLIANGQATMPYEIQTYVVAEREG